jgi:hypothetical protein
MICKAKDLSQREAEKAKKDGSMRQIGAKKEFQNFQALPKYNEQACKNDIRFKAFTRAFSCTKLTKNGGRSSEIHFGVDTCSAQVGSHALDRRCSAQE